MFTGIIECAGTISAIRKKGGNAEISIEFSAIDGAITLGESIAVDGVCLTVKSFSPEGFSADISSETLAVTTLGVKKRGEKVNIERAMKYGGRIGGHFVTGHIDGIGVIKARKADSQGGILIVKAPESIMEHIIRKGSVAVDGISLTVAETGESEFSVALIPHTMNNTVLKTKKAGEQVNLEADMLGKYVARAVESYMSAGKKEKINLEFLKNSGFID